MTTVEPGSWLEDVEKLDTLPLRERVYRRLKQLILTNRLLPGQQIVIDQLSRQLGVSHTPIREALAMLELDGLVDLTRYKNPHITEIRKVDVEQVYEMRILMEGWAASVAATKLTDGTIADLDRSLKEVLEEAKRGQIEHYLENDIMFHNAIAHTVNNSLFDRLTELIAHQSIRIRSLVEATGQSKVETQINEHISVLTAIHARDADKAREAMETHLSHALQRTLAAMEHILQNGSDS